MDVFLADVALGVLIALAYAAAWVAWLTLGILPFVLAGLAYVGVRHGLPSLAGVIERRAARGWGALRQAVAHPVPRAVSLRRR